MKDLLIGSYFVNVIHGIDYLRHSELYQLMQTVHLLCNLLLYIEFS